MGVWRKCKNFGEKGYKLAKRIASMARDGYLFQKRYLYYLENCPVKEKIILLESQQGKSVDGNIYYILKELNDKKEYASFTIYLSTQGRHVEKFKNFLKNNHIDRVRIVTKGRLLYYKILATAKYLVNDNTFLFCFVKRKEQVYLNTWHGTPLKTLGRKIKSEFYAIGNAQKNFMVADYLLYPNEFTRDHMLEDYMISNVGTAKVILEGYPRNTAFFQEKEREAIRERLGLKDKKVFAYMPTWRGIMGNIQGKEQNNQLLLYLNEIDRQLTDQQILYLNLHPVTEKSIHLSDFTHIRHFPGQYETYQFLNAADCLITDYSSVMFDFANTGRKIVLFTYDEEEYLRDRGLYFPMEELPFSKVNTVGDLMKELNSEKNYLDQKFLEKFCPYDSLDSTRKLCERVILDRNDEVRVESIPSNGKENVLIYAGDFELNGVTTSIQNLLNHIDRTKRNYYILYKIKSVQRNAEVLRTLPDDIFYLGYFFTGSLSLGKTIKMKLWKKAGMFSYKSVKDSLELMAVREKRRLVGDCQFQHVIHFSGYENDVIHMFMKFTDSNIIYVHNDMEQEIKFRHNQNKDVLHQAYKEYNKVAVVTEDLIESTARLEGGEENIVVVKNLINYRKVLANAEKELEYNKGTKSDVTVDRLKEILDSNSKKFISIGRFSTEKGHKRLLTAFDRLYEENQNIYLIIIGGRGALYQETVEFANGLVSRSHIILIKFMYNPFPILKRCDYFILSSIYEGFGLVLAEADILGIPCVSTDITGPKVFMEKYGGKLVESSEQGVYDGMKSCLLGEVKDTLGVDYEQYNQEAIEQFESLFL